jgi:hypothetical protein
MFMRRRRWLRGAMIGGGAFAAGRMAGRKSARRLAEQARQAQHHDDERNERLATDPEFTAAKSKRFSG